MSLFPAELSKAAFVLFEKAITLILTSESPLNTTEVGERLGLESILGAEHKGNFQRDILLALEKRGIIKTGSQRSGAENSWELVR